MFLVMGVTGKVGGATARHLLAHGKRVRALVRSREKAADWMDQGVELVDGDWNDTAAIERALDGVDGAFVMLPAVWAPSPDFKEAKGVIANYVEVLTKAAPPRVVALSSMGANRTSGLGMITALSLLEQGFDVVIGSRRAEGARVESPRPLHRRLGSRGFRAAVWLLLPALRGVPDTQCGFKFFQKEAARALFAAQRVDGYMFDVELLVLAAAAGYRVKQVGLRWRDDGDSRLDLLSGNWRNLVDLLRIRGRAAGAQARARTGDAPSAA